MCVCVREREREGREGGRENNGNDKSSKLFKKTSRHIHSMSLTEKKNLHMWCFYLTSNRCQKFFCSSDHRWREKGGEFAKRSNNKISNLFSQ